MPGVEAADLINLGHRVSGLAFAFGVAAGRADFSFGGKPGANCSARLTHRASSLRSRVRVPKG